MKKYLAIILTTVLLGDTMRIEYTDGTVETYVMQ